MVKAAKPSTKKKEARSVAKQARAYKPASPSKKRQIVVPKPGVDYVDSSKLTEDDLVEDANVWVGSDPPPAEYGGHKLGTVKDCKERHCFVVMARETEYGCRPRKRTIKFLINYKYLSPKQKLEALFKACVQSQDKKMLDRQAAALKHCAQRVLDSELKGVADLKPVAFFREALLEAQRETNGKAAESMEDGIFRLVEKLGSKVILMSKAGTSLSKREVAKILAAPVKGALCFSLYKEYTDHARVSVVNANSHFHFDRRERKGSEPPSGRLSHRKFAGSFKDYLNKNYGQRGDMFKHMARKAYPGLSHVTCDGLVDAGFFQTDHIFGTICDDPENFFLMPAPHNGAFSLQSRQNFKKDFTGPGWDGVVYFVEKALAMQRKYGRY